MVVRVSPSVTSNRQFQAVVLGLKLMGKDLRRDINKATRDDLNPVWKALVAVEAQNHQDYKILTPGTRIVGGNPPSVQAASGNKKLSGGGTPNSLGHAYEFGTPNRQEVNTYDRRNKKTGGTHKVTRHTSRQLPYVERKGRVIYPAFAMFAPRMVSLWVQMVVRKTHEAFEKGDI